MKKFAVLLVASLSAWTLRAEDPASFDVGGLEFSRPADWKWVEVSSPMRKAQLKVSGAKSGAADVVFFYFGSGQGGDAQANAKRWLGQFKSAPGAEKTEPLEAGGRKLTLVSTEGTYQGGMPGAAPAPLENQALLGAIVEGPEGNIFVKMTGDAELVKASRERFVGFVTAAAPKK